MPNVVLNDEEIERRSKGVIKNEQGYSCIQCGNQDPQYFYSYQSVENVIIVYCRKCIQLGRMDSISDYRITKSKQSTSLANYHLPFNLSEQQQYASQKIIDTIEFQRDLLLYAVTGAGKTEMMFDGIQTARRKGYNIAIVSPRVDVVVEISHRIKEAFKHESIDILHQHSNQQYNGHFVIATVHQLFRFKQHFNVIFVDEVDAFPLSMDQSLMNAIQLSSTATHSHILMTATPPYKLIKSFDKKDVIHLPARFHRKPLPVPVFKYFKLNIQRVQLTLMNLFKKQIKTKRYTLVFFNHIETMIKAFQIYKKYIPNLVYVHSEDLFRFEKVESLRRGEHSIVFTTTILERGFTMAELDVIVIDAHTFNKTALVQIAGRVGRKLSCPQGTVNFLHEGVSINMILARHDIKKMNRLGYQRGWLDE